jgi:hypothetical protein
MLRIGEERKIPENYSRECLHPPRWVLAGELVGVVFRAAPGIQGSSGGGGGTDLYPPDDHLLRPAETVVNDKGNPPGKLADAELHFEAGDGVLEGLKLIGFGVWERRASAGRNVTFPARQYSVAGERRSFALLRPVADATAQNRIRDLILQAYEEHEAQTSEVAR